MIEGLQNLLADSGQPGLAELRGVLADILDGDTTTVRLIGEEKLKTSSSRIFRARFATNGTARSFVLKRMQEPAMAWRNEYAINRWLPATGLSDGGPALFGIASDRKGQHVWHIYEDLGDCALDSTHPELGLIESAANLIARLHTRFARHPLLPECRMYGGDRGIHFYTSSLRDAIYGLEALRQAATHLSAERKALCGRLLERLYALLEEQTFRGEALADLGGPETFLHGDLWPTNTFVLRTANGNQARLIDWDHAGAGPFSYDLSTFLVRFPVEYRFGILQMYAKAVAPAGWHLPATKELNLLFQTAEFARYANCLIWPAIALLREQAEWGAESLAEIERWFENWQMVLPEHIGGA